MTFSTISSDTCQKCCSARPAEAGRVDIGEGQPGIVDQDVDAAEAVPRLGDDPVALARAAQIGDQRPDLPGNCSAAPRLDLADIGGDMTDRGDPMPGARQPQHHRPPETAQPAGHQRHSVRHASSRPVRTAGVPARLRPEPAVRYPIALAKPEITRSAGVMMKIYRTDEGRER